MIVTGTVHRHHMQRALHLAARGRGRTSPNPLTGCVVVKDGRVIGEGFHARLGARHAEAAALDACRESPRGAHLYCNLEPCAATYPGKLTPPCAGRIIGTGIAQVTVATLDPNPHVSGAGVRLLREAGIAVTVGVEAEDALRLNVPFFTAVHYRRPFVHLKVAQSLDGRIATRNGNSRWITDTDARRMVHRMRAEHDAILVGTRHRAARRPATHRTRRRARRAPRGDCHGAWCWTAGSPFPQRRVWPATSTPRAPWC